MRNEIRFNSSLIASSAAMALSVVSVALLLLTVGGAMLPGPSDHQMNETLAALLDEHGEKQQTYVDRFNGRSIFFTPVIRRPPRQAPPPPPEPDVPEIEIDLPPPGPPATYRGPAVIAFFGQTVWFEDDLMLSIGQESDGINGVRVIGMVPPWHVKLGWKNGEYEVALFDDDFSDLEDHTLMEAGTPILTPVDLPAKAEEEDKEVEVADTGEENAVGETDKPATADESGPPPADATEDDGEEEETVTATDGGAKEDPEKDKDGNNEGNETEVDPTSPPRTVIDPSD